MESTQWESARLLRELLQSVSVDRRSLLMTLLDGMDMDVLLQVLAEDCGPSGSWECPN